MTLPIGQDAKALHEVMTSLHEVIRILSGKPFVLQLTHTATPGSSWYYKELADILALLPAGTSLILFSKIKITTSANTVVDYLWHDDVDLIYSQGAGVTATKDYMADHGFPVALTSWFEIDFTNSSGGNEDQTIVIYGIYW